MKKKKFFQRAAALSILLMAGVGVLVQSGFVFKKTTSSEPKYVSSTTVLLNQRPLIYNSIIPKSRGLMALVTNDPATTEVTQIPFRVYLKRGNIILSRAASNPDQAGQEVEISKMLSIAMVGDQLIVEPIKTKQGNEARRSDAPHLIRVDKYAGVNLIPIRFFPVPNNGDGC